jgi:hypothetical protein
VGRKGLIDLDKFAVFFQIDDSVAGRAVSHRWLVEKVDNGATQIAEKTLRPIIIPSRLVTYALLEVETI